MKSGTWEQRWHPLREEWVIIAAHRDDSERLPWKRRPPAGIGKNNSAFCWKTLSPVSRPTAGESTAIMTPAGLHFHIEFRPPLRSANLIKYLAGPEVGGGSFLSDTSPEQKAAELRTPSTAHYKTATENHAP